MVIIIIIALLINIVISIKFGDIATEKGYTGKNYFWACFFLGVAGYIMVAALPDLELHYRLSKLETEASSQPVKPQVHSNSTERSNPPPQGNWVCSCGRVNANYVTSCTCGKSKRDVAK